MTVNWWHERDMEMLVWKGNLGPYQSHFLTGKCRSCPSADGDKPDLQWSYFTHGSTWGLLQRNVKEEQDINQEPLYLGFVIIYCY